jgi:hypothetical protein
VAPGTAAWRQPWRWPLGWLFILGFALGLGMWGGLAWLWLHRANYEHYPWMGTVLQLELPYMAWLAVAALGGLGLVMTINNVIRQAWRRALRWLLLAGLAALHCAASLLPMVVAMGGGVTPDVPQEETAAGK